MRAEKAENSQRDLGQGETCRKERSQTSLNRQSTLYERGGETSFFLQRTNRIRAQPFPLNLTRFALNRVDTAATCNIAVRRELKYDGGIFDTNNGITRILLTSPGRRRMFRDTSNRAHFCDSRTQDVSIGFRRYTTQWSVAPRVQWQSGQSMKPYDHDVSTVR